MSKEHNLFYLSISYSTAVPNKLPKYICKTRFLRSRLCEQFFWDDKLVHIFRSRCTQKHLTVICSHKSFMSAHRTRNHNPSGWKKDVTGDSFMSFFFFLICKYFALSIFRSIFLHCGLVRFLFLAKIHSLSTATDELRIKCSHKTKTQKSNKMWRKHTHVQTHMAVPRSRVANDVFTLVWGDCYFCAEPDNSIIHCGCWCTHFTSIEGGGAVSCSWCVFHVCMSTVCMHLYARVLCAWEDPPTADELLTCQATQRERKRGRKGKGAVINMAIKEIWSGRWGSKSRGRRGKELVPLSSL